MRNFTCLLLVILLLIVSIGCSKMPIEAENTEQTEITSLAKKALSTWEVPGDFATIQEAIDHIDVMPGDIIRVGTGNHAGAYVSKSVIIKGKGGAVINSGPMHPAGFFQDPVPVYFVQTCNLLN